MYKILLSVFLTITAAIVIQQPYAANAMLLSAQSSNSLPPSNPEGFANCDTAGTCNSMPQSQLGCTGQKQTLILDRNDLHGRIINQNPCLSIVVVGNNDDHHSKHHHEHNDDSADTNNNGPVQTSDQQQQPLQQIEQPTGTGSARGADSNGAGLNDACLKSGFSQQKCDNILFSKNPGGACTTVAIAGVSCPSIQDPAKTFSDPKGALAESQARTRATENAIQGFDRLFPPGPNGFAKSFGSSTG